MISILIPLYNKEKHIGNTLRSVLSQTFPHFEVIIVDDGSTDNSIGVVRQFCDSRIRIVEQPNRGVSAARNRGIEEAHFDYIALLDADDEWEPAYLENQAGLIESFPHCSVFACAYRFKDNGIISPALIKRLLFRERGVLNNYFEVACSSHPPLWTSAVVVRKEALLAVGGFPLGVSSGEDLLTWARLATGYPIAYNTFPQAFYCFSNECFNKAPRRLDKEDTVSEGLKQLYRTNTDAHLKKYIGWWYKTRASTLLRYGKAHEILKESLSSLYYRPNAKMLLYMLLAFFPVGIRLYLMKKITLTIKNR